MLLALPGLSMASPTPTFAPQRSAVVGPLSWGLSSCAPGMCPWCLLNCGHQDLDEAEHRARIILEELERVAAPHWAGHLVVLLLHWCRSELLHFHAETLDGLVPRVSLIALGIYAGLRVPAAFNIFGSGPSASSSAAPAAPAMVRPPPGIAFPHATGDVSQPRKIPRPSSRGGDSIADACVLPPMLPLSTVPPPAVKWLGYPIAAEDPVFEYWGGKRTLWVPYDLDDQMLLRASYAAGGSIVEIVCQGTKYFVDTRPLPVGMTQSNPITGQGPRSIRIRPPEPVD